jgi:hypothetical protein
MKKTLLLLASLFAVSLLPAQTYFSKTLDFQENNVLGTASGNMALRLSTGEFVSASVGEGSALEIRKFDANGVITSAHRQPAMAMPGIGTITTMDFMDGESSVLLSGVGFIGDPSIGATFGFFIAKLNLSTMAITYNWRSWPHSPYTFSQAVSITDDGIFVVQPYVAYAAASRYDFDLNHEWSKGFLQDEVDSTFSKNPSMGGNCIDTTLVITCKQQDSLSFLRVSTNGDVLGSRRYSSPSYTRIYETTSSSDGNMFLAGFNTTSAVLIKATPEGSPIWSKGIACSYLASIAKVIELPNGDILALGGNFSQYLDEFDAYVLLDENGIVKDAGFFNSSSSSMMQFQGPTVSADGITSAGSIYDFTASKYRNALHFTDFDLSQICGFQSIAASSYDITLGTFTDLTSGSINSWNISAPIQMNQTLEPFTAVQPTDCETITATEDALASTFQVSPNPVSQGSNLLLSLPSLAKGTARLTDLQGRQLLSAEVSAQQNVLPLEGIAPGLYLLTLEQDGARIGTQRVVVN